MEASVHGCEVSKVVTNRTRRSCEIYVETITPIFLIHLLLRLQPRRLKKEVNCCLPC
jgi:hypothetical protein